MLSDAVFPDIFHRTSLLRWWGDGLCDVRHMALWIMLNPSTADATVDDPTIRRVTNFTRREGLDGFVVVNQYSFRSPSPKMLARHLNTLDMCPVCADGVELARQELKKPYPLVVAAWGASHPGPWTLPVRVPHHSVCLGKTKELHPRHPLYVAGCQPFVRYR